MKFNPDSKLVKLANVGDTAHKLPETPKAKERPKIIPDVEPPKVQEPPTEESIKVEQKLIRLREDMQSAMKEFNNLFKVNTLPENRSEAERNRENQVFNVLINKSNYLNDLSPGEGTMSLNVLCLRHLLSLKDAGNKLAYQTYLLEKSEFGEATEDKKRKQVLMDQKAELDEKRRKLDEELSAMEE